MPDRSPSKEEREERPRRLCRSRTSVPEALLPKSKRAKAAPRAATSARRVRQRREDDVMEEETDAEQHHPSDEEEEAEEEEEEENGDADDQAEEEEEEDIFFDTAGDADNERPVKRGRGRPKTAEVAEFKLSVTISKKGEDLKCQDYVQGLQEYAAANTVKFYMSAERGAIEKHQHFQGMAIVRTTTLAAFRKALYKAMGFGLAKEGLDPTPPGLSICLKQLSGKGLHTPNGIIGYARKESNSQDGGEFEEW